MPTQEEIDNMELNKGEEPEEVLAMKAKIDKLMLLVKSAEQRQIAILKRQIADLQKENGNLKCCGNCDYHNSGHKVSTTEGIACREYAGTWCRDWTTDGLTREEREK